MSDVGMAKPSPPVRQAGNIGRLLVIHGVCRRSVPRACPQVKYRCRCRDNHGLNAWIATESPGTWRLEVVRRPEGSTGFVLVPKRWVVERTLAWLGRCRRHSKDYERRTDSSESMIRISAIHLMLKRLQPSNVYRPFRYRDAA